MIYDDDYDDIEKSAPLNSPLTKSILGLSVRTKAVSASGSDLVPHCKLGKFIYPFGKALKPQPSAICPVWAIVEPKCVWQPGSARTCWGSLRRSPDLLAGFRKVVRNGRIGRERNRRKG